MLDFSILRDLLLFSEIKFAKMLMKNFFHNAMKSKQHL